MVDDEEFLELVEMEIRELLQFLRVSMVTTLLLSKVQLLVHLNKEPKWVEKIMELMEAV